MSEKVCEPKGGCLSEALRLLEENGGGEVRWVGKMQIDNKDIDVHHAYFIPSGAQDSALALNQSDNGFGEYPLLTVGQLRQVGTVQDPEILRQYRKGKYNG